MWPSLGIGLFVTIWGYPGLVGFKGKPTGTPSPLFWDKPIWEPARMLREWSRCWEWTHRKKAAIGNAFYRLFNLSFPPSNQQVECKVLCAELQLLGGSSKHPPVSPCPSMDSTLHIDHRPYPSDPTFWLKGHSISHCLLRTKKRGKINLAMATTVY